MQFNFKVRIAVRPYMSANAFHFSFCRNVHVHHSQPKAEGVLEAAFDGNHGWFWRNRGAADVKLTLKTEGAYSDIKQMK